MPQMLAEYGPRLRSKSTLRYMEKGVRVLNEMGVKSTSDLTVQLMSRIVATRNPDASPNSVRSLLRSLSAICSHAVNFGFLPSNPFLTRPIRTLVRASKPKGTRHLTKVQVSAILRLLEQDVRERQGWALYRARRLQALVTLICWTGLRKSEALWCHVEDLELDEGIVLVVSRASHRLKTAGSEQPVVCPPPAVKILRDWLVHRTDAPAGFERQPSPYLFPNVRTPTPWVEGSPGTTPLDRLKAVALRAGVEGATYQKLRASVATHMEAAGCGAAQIQRQLRHSNVGTTQNHYMRADRENMRKAMENFGF